MIKVTYFYSACVAIETADARILCDPWFTDAAFDGAWYIYPKLDDPLTTVGKADFIYISHIHPDHYDSTFLKSYLDRHDVRILIADFENNYLSKRMTADGFSHEVIRNFSVGETEIGLFPRGKTPFDIDSALAVKHCSHAVVNMNDSIYHEPQIEQILAFTGPRPEIGLLGYSAASGYPQRFYDDPKTLEEKKSWTIRRCLDRYKILAGALDPQVRIPFAGQYVIGGANWEYTKWMAFADAFLVSEFDPAAVVLADGGKASIDTGSLKPTAVRTEWYDFDQVIDYVRTTAKNSYTWENYFGGLPDKMIPLKRLLPKAYATALSRSLSEDKDWYWCFSFDDEWFVCNANKRNPESYFCADIGKVSPRTEIVIDKRYMFGLLTGVFHWNNAFIGSHFAARRHPDEFNPNIENFINFFHI